MKAKTLKKTINYVIEMLKTEGFGIITEIDIQKAFKEKINVDFRKYRILGACNPHFAYKALQVEDKIGVFLPCNVVVQEHFDGRIEVNAIKPLAAMSSVENKTLEPLALEVENALKRVMEKL